MQEHSSRSGESRALDPLQFAVWTPVTVLCVVAVAQLVVAHLLPLTPWKGGGFGMFSTVDAPPARVVEVYAIGADERRILIQTPRELARAKRRLQAVPTQADARDILASLRNQEFVAHDHHMRTGLAAESRRADAEDSSGEVRVCRPRVEFEPLEDGARLVVSRVGLVVWRLRYIAEARVEREVLLELEFGVRP